MNRVNELLPEVLRKELIRLAKLDRDWVEWVPKPSVNQNLTPGSSRRFKEGDNVYSLRAKYPTWIAKLWTNGADAFSMWGASIWLVDGPKVFRPSPEQCRALEQIEVRLELNEYAQPYPAILIELPEGKYEPFNSVLCHKSEKLLTCMLNSRDHLNDITTTIAVDGRPIETSLQKFDDDLAPLAKVSSRALRIAVNSCLALVNYGCHASALYPKEVERDRALAAEDSERGCKAKERLKEAIRLVTFDQEVRLHKSETHGPSTGEGSKKRSHWRRGHWHTVLFGVGKSQRKLKLFPPVLIHGDDLAVDPSDTTVVYS